MSALGPSRRTWSDQGRTRREIDSAARARAIKAFAWAAFPGIFMGGIVMRSAGPLVGLGVGLAVFLGVGGFALLWTEGVGAATSHMLAPGTGLARAPVNSRAEALETRGEFREAATAWEVTALEHPDHPEPAARLARLHRDRLGDPETALTWFKRAVERAGMDGDVRVVMRELVETARKIEPTGRAAAPILARYREVKGDDSAEGEWAGRELAAIKESMADG